MKKRILMLIGSVCLALMLALPLVAGCAGPTPTPAPTTHRWLTGSTSITSSWYALYAAQAAIANKYIPGAEVTVIETGGFTDNVKRMLAGEIASGSSGPGTLYEAVHGLGKWEANPQENKLRFLFANCVTYSLFWVREDSGVTRPSDLEGRRFFSGMPGTVTESICTVLLGSDCLDIHPDYFIGSVTDGLNAIKDGRAVGWMKLVPGPGSGAHITELLTATDMRVFGLSEEEAEKFKARAPWFPLARLPAGYFTDFPDAPALIGLGIQNILAVREDFPEDIAYLWTKAGVEHFDVIEQAWPIAKNIDPTDAPQWCAQTEGSYLHPGAIRYFREIGIEIPESVIPPEMK